MMLSEDKTCQWIVTAFLFASGKIQKRKVVSCVPCQCFFFGVTSFVFIFLNNPLSFGMEGWMEGRYQFERAFVIPRMGSCAVHKWITQCRRQKVLYLDKTTSTIDGIKLSNHHQPPFLHTWCSAETSPEPFPLRIELACAGGHSRMVSQTASLRLMGMSSSLLVTSAISDALPETTSRGNAMPHNNSPRHYKPCM